MNQKDCLLANKLTLPSLPDTVSQFEKAEFNAFKKTLKGFTTASGSFNPNTNIVDRDNYNNKESDQVKKTSVAPQVEQVSNISISDTTCCVNFTLKDFLLSLCSVVEYRCAH